MALLPTKTYSKVNNELSVATEKEKENVNPFDELLSSPLKQDVQFQPLSYWGRKEKDSKTKKSGTIKCGLFEGSDSDDHNSPLQRKTKLKSKSLASKQTSKFKSSRKVVAKRKNSTACSSLSCIKHQKSVASNEIKSFIPAEVLDNNNNSLPNKTTYLNEDMEETLKSEYDNLKYKNIYYASLGDSCCSSLSWGNYGKSSRSFSNGKNYQRNMTFKVFEDPINDTTVDEGKSVNSTMQFDESMEKTLKPVHDSSDFVDVKSQNGFPFFYSLPDNNLNSVGLCKNQNSSSQSWNDTQISSITIVNGVNDSDKMKSIGDHDDGTEYFINDTLLSFPNESMDKTFCTLNSTTLTTEEAEAVENTFDFMSSESIIDVIQQLLEEHYANAQNRLIADLNSTSDDTVSETTDEDTVTEIAVEPQKSPTPNKGFEEKEISNSNSPSNEVPQLTSKISDLTISNATDDELSEPELEDGKSNILVEHSNLADKEDSFSIDLRNVTTKRRWFLNNGHEENVPKTNDSRFRCSAVRKKIQVEKNAETEFDFDQTFQIPRVNDRMSLDWNKTVSFSNPMFESTRVLDMSALDKKKSQGQTIFEESGFDQTFVLKPGKKWMRSMCVLKQLQNGNIIKGRLESTRITGRKFESFVQDMIEMQNASSKISNKTLTGANVQDSFADGFSCYETVSNIEEESNVSEFFSVNDSVLTKSTTDRTVSEKVLLNRTVKVIQPDESSRAFRSALGLETSSVSIQEDLAEEESLSLSARSFILIQCGQEDVLPFEEYFNERTLTNCKKIGEGVYGEVFMCSDTVIKIIPIEGSDKVNGEPQKTFEEIISEVVIASKLSNLRKGEKNQTDGFSEMKRCWCVKGKYPKHLLDLWDEYDQLGSGSENDSPIMFKDDQLYIILELANGGKDLESFVFTSAAQSLSLLIQTAFSLAVAEKAFEFEHRDLHWGNILISETKDKFMTVILDGTKYEIPTKGVKVCIIDFTLSRMNHEGCCIFNDLSVDPGLFVSEGDYQFEIYRMMLREVNNDWSLFRPKTNLFWLHYVIDKMIKMVRYKNKKGKVHSKHQKNLKTLESIVLDHCDTTDFVLSSTLSTLRGNL